MRSVQNSHQEVDIVGFAEMGAQRRAEKRQPSDVVAAAEGRQGIGGSGGRQRHGSPPRGVALSNVPRRCGGTVPSIGLLLPRRRRSILC